MTSGVARGGWSLRQDPFVSLVLGSHPGSGPFHTGEGAVGLTSHPLDSAQKD